MYAIRIIITSILTLSWSGLSHSRETAAAHSPLPKILLIGDSIAGGYQRGVKNTLVGKAVVVKNEGNAEWTGTGIQKIDAWLGDTKWDIIHFNWGLWDLYGWKYHEQDRSPEAYSQRLEQLVSRMEKTGAKLIWATTTPACPAAEVTMKQRFKTEVVIPPEAQAKYHEAALAVMKKHGVQVNDLYQAILPNMAEYSVSPDDVHFHAEGSAFLAQQVALVLENAIAARKP
jgi:acyl-CoA thioesterase-1